MGGSETHLLFFFLIFFFFFNFFEGLPDLIQGVRYCRIAQQNIYIKKKKKIKNGV